MLVPCPVVGGLRSRKYGSPTGTVLPLPGGVHIHLGQAGNRRMVRDQTVPRAWAKRIVDPGEAP